MNNVFQLPAKNMRRDPQAAEFLYEIRRECDSWDIDELAATTGISRAALYAFRSGRTKFPRPKTLFAILDALGFEMVVVRHQTNEVYNVRLK